MVSIAMAPWFLFAALAAAPPSGYVGAQVCGGCHPKQAKTQAVTGHARSLRPAAQHPLAAKFPSSATAYRPEKYRLELQQGVARVTDGQNWLEAPFEWAFGAGDQAVTFVSQLDDDHYLEHHLSFYGRTGRFATTPGHRTLRPVDLRSALGVLYPTLATNTAILRCFQCHSTGPLRLLAGLRIQPAELGVRCESCHGAGNSHAASRRPSAIFNPGKLDADGLNRYCGNCHRPPATDSVDWEDPWNTRHQPVYLSQSACFTKSGGRLTCLTCHEPHSPLRRNDAAFYDAKCASCHQSKAAACGPRDCASCHMPKVAPQPELRFSNHWIGVYPKGSVLRPGTR